MAQGNAMRIERITRYPVKGLSPEELDEVELTAGEGLPGDRQFAFAQGDSGFDPAAPVWMKKRNFACLAVNARVAALRTAYDPLTRILVLRHEADGIMADLSKPDGRRDAAAWMTAFLGEEARGALTLAEAPGHAFTDIPDKAVSLIGLSSIAELGARMGTELDPLRFRANFLVSGSPPFAELDLVGQEAMLGGARVRVFHRIQRCAATEVNPATAQRDAAVPRALRRTYGHADMGVYAEVLQGGRVAVGDTLIGL
jgi:uncharacterized protein YcbX